MKFTKQELTVIKDLLYETLESEYNGINNINAKELAFAKTEDFDEDSHHNILDTQSALKKVIEEIVNDTAT